ncbi:putative membrane protein [Spongiibacter sp. IMCC21906]|uniref:LapA family protein n=1 Tax=Spongiibacter sp. IMCC21906 TaxID=1620392 RepID=UPI00062E0AD5|nr:LapA family protein [Spongiibacter sp. IMCC21906]AKH70049.1 putative membrane protein [Spongiibacter sp. IMCC21906]
MRWIKSLLLIVVLLLVLALGLLFTIENDVVVPLNILIMELPEQRLSTWLILSFFAGGILGMLAASFAMARLQASRLVLKRKLANLEGQRSGVTRA